MIERRQVVRPVAVAIAFTLAGEVLIFLIWGISLFPVGAIWRKLIWTTTCGVAMGASIGAFVNVFVTGQLRPPKAPIAAAAIYFSVLAFCVALCYQIDLSIGFFGAREAPWLFILGGLIPALVTSYAYAWLLYSNSGQAILTRVGL